MSMTARRLCEHAELESHIAAGHAGQDRPITWAHSCEMDEPSHWLGHGHLVMTTGLALEPDAKSQRRYIERAHAAGIVGLAIGLDMHAPKLSEELFRAADELGFVVILTKREVPFVAMSRIVADAELELERSRNQRTMHVYETVLRTMTGPYSGSALLSAVAAALECEVRLVDKEGRRLLDDTPTPPPDHWRSADATPRVLPVPGFPYAQLELRSRPEPREEPLEEPAILHHLSLLAALEMQRRDGDRERSLRRGSSVLAHLVDGREGPAQAKRDLSSIGLPASNLVMLTGARPHDLAAAFHALCDLGLRSAFLARGDRVHVLLDATTPDLEAIANRLGRLGVSDVCETPDVLPTAFIQSNLAYDSARETARAVVPFSERTVSLLPDDAASANSLVLRVLGPLLDSDASRGTDYIRTLRVFLEENRGWTKAAERLHLHRQTLVYRISRISQLTGYSLDQTSSVAILWVALNTLDTFRDALRGPSPRSAP